MPAVSHSEVERDSESELSDEEQKQLVEEAIERLDMLAASQVETAKLFIGHGKRDIARRRLQEVVDLYGKSAAAREARAMLRKL